MPKTPAVKPKKLIKILEANGFELDHASGSHFVFYCLASRKRVTVPKHNRDLAIGTLFSILREAGLSKEDLI